jgi:hypothetical protein
MTAEQQIAALVAIGYTLADAAAVVSAALALVPPGADPATWLPSAESLDAPIDDADVAQARNEWYATAPDAFARLLDAGEVVPDA